MSGLALISDIHGNAVALNAVLADLARRDVDELVCLGDIAAGGPQPREVIARVRELQCECVRGNGEGWLLEGLPQGRSGATRRLDEVVEWARAQLAPEDLDYLAGLPATLSCALPATLSCAAGGMTLFCFHGSPRADIDVLLATTPEAELDERFADAPAVAVLAGGHTHIQLLRPYQRSLLVNPGSVGLPLDSLTETRPPLPAWAEYAIVEVGDAGVEIAFRRVPIDIDQLAAATAAMPHLTWAADLELRIRRWNARAS
jgi:predicted phosphodiesterase